MLRKFVSTLAILSSVLVLSACIEIEIRTKINPDGSGIQQWSFTTSALFAGKIREQVKNEPLFKGLNLELSEEYKEGDFILKTRVPFQSVSQIKNDYFESHLQKSGFFRTRYDFTQTWKALPKNGKALFQDSVEGFGPNALRISVEVSGSIVGSNADTVEGSTAHWSIPMSPLTQNRVLRVQWLRWNPNRIAAISLLALVTALAVFVIIRKRGQPSTAKLPEKTGAACPQCGSIVPEGSTFCNKCGVKL